MKYVLNEKKLEPLDIILTKNKKLTSKGIRLLTQGDYSHALIYMSSFSAIEATREGRVFSENVQRLIFDGLDECKVIRYKKQLTEEQSEKIAYYARSQVTTLYSIKEAIRVKSLRKKDVCAIERTQFCSRLVAQAYFCAGLDLTHNPDYCSPQDLNNSNLLFEVKDVLREATDWHLSFAETLNPIKENAKHLYEWLDKVAELAKREKIDILSQTDAEKFIIDFPEYDAEICGYILNTNYLNFYDNDEKINPARYNFDPMVDLDIVSEIEMCISNVERYLVNFARSKSTAVATSLNYYELQVTLFENLLDQCLKHLETIIQHIFVKIDAKSYVENKALMYIGKFQMDKLAEDIKNARDGDGYLAYIRPELI